MRCRKCKRDNPDDAKFCVGCGNPFEGRCAKCGAENPTDASFCKQCGTRLGAKAASSAAIAGSERVSISAEQAAATALDGERKTVTVLFADIKGSMDLIEDLDPEEARAIVQPALKLMMEAVHHYGGYVAQSTGDGIFALFGAPLAHEDHPQRALYAALRMQEELKRYSDRIRTEGRLPIQARVGVNIGEVVVQSIATGEGRSEYVPVGHSTGIAARMQALAPVGSIAATEPIWKLCEGYFLFKSLGPTRVKGVSEPVNVYEVTGLGLLRTRLQRAAARGYTKFVGREREFETLRRTAEQARAGHGQIVATMAEPGVGKSRLFFEFKAKNQSGWVVLEAFSASYGKASAYLPVLDLLHTYFKITSDDDARARRERVAGKITVLDRALEDTLPYLFALLGIVEGEDPLAQMDAQIRRRRTQDAVKRILLRESLNQPLMLIFEDLHWIDEETQGFLNMLAEGMPSAAVLLLVNYRPEYSHQWNSKTYYTQLRLDPLGRESAEEMLSVLLGDGAELAPLKRVIIEKTESNPLFMEELVEALFEEGVLVRDGAVKLTRPLSQLKISPTVQGILAARIDRLPPEAKELLQTLAVIGMEFPLSLVRELIQKPPEQLDGLLGGLQTGEFIYEQPAAGDVEYKFKHALTHDVAYKTLLAERRKPLHERTARAIESMFARHLEDHLDELAHHYSHSDNVPKAVEYLERAGQQALQRSAYADAMSSFITAIDLLQRLADGPERGQRELLLQLAAGPAIMAVKGYAAPEVERLYIRMRQLCKEVGDPPELSPALWGLWIVYLLRGEIPKAYPLAEQLLRRAQSTDDPAELMHGHIALGHTSYWMGELLRARKHLELAISLYDRERNRPLTFRYGVDSGVRCLTYAAWTLWQLGYPDQGLKRVNEALALAQALSQPFSVAWAEFVVGVLSQYGRKACAAREAAEIMIALSAEHGITDFLAYATIMRGWAMAEQGHNEAGIAQVHEGLAATRRTGAELARPYFLCLLAEVCMETGRPDDGLGALREALVAADENENRNSEPEMHRLKGELLLKQGDSNAAEARTCFQRAIEIARKQSAKSWELRATMSLARLLHKQGKRDEARAMLSDIYNWFTEGFDTADLTDAKALLDQLNQ